MDQRTDGAVVFPSMLEPLLERIEALEASIGQLAERAQSLEDRLFCKHEPFFLPGMDDPLRVVAIADARKMDIIAPGQPPPLAFALGICRKCWQIFPLVNTIDEAKPFEGGLPSPKLVQPGEVVE